MKKVLVLGFLSVSFLFAQEVPSDIAKDIEAIEQSEANKELQPQGTEKKSDFQQSVADKINAKLDNLDAELANRSLSTANPQISVDLAGVQDETVLKKKEMPVMVGSFELKRAKKHLVSNALAVDSKHNTYYLSKKNNEIVKKIREDHIVYDDGDDKPFVSTMVYDNEVARDDYQMKISSEGTINSKELEVVEPTPAIQEKVNNGELPTLEQTVNSYKAK